MRQYIVGILHGIYLYNGAVRSVCWRPAWRVCRVWRHEDHDEDMPGKLDLSLATPRRDLAMFE